jgi:outer membrane protein TolC
MMAHVVRRLAPFVVVLAPALVCGQDSLTVQQAVARAQAESFASRMASNTRDAARERNRAFSASFLPQISLAGDLPVYNRSIIPVVQPDGSTLFRAQQQNQAGLNLRVGQRLPWTGGDLFIQSSLARIDITGQQSTRNWQSTPFLVGLSQPLLRPNTQKWNVREQDLEIETSEREFIEAREELAVATSNAFFDHYAARVALQNAVNNAAVNDTLYTLNQGRFEVGKIGENDLLQSELALLRSRNALSAARLEHDRTLAALRLQLNLPASAPLSVSAMGSVPQVSPDTAVAVAQALRNRSQMTQLELNEVQAKRRVSEARLNTGFGASLQASVGYNQSSPEFDLAYRDLRNAQRLALAITTPLITWGQRGAQVQAARADERRVEENRRLAREQIVQEAHFAALQLIQARGQLELAGKADTVATKRFDVAKNRYVIGRIGMDNLYLAQQEKDQALQGYLQALRGYWGAYYRLRRVTLYDFERGSPIR